MSSFRFSDTKRRVTCRITKHCRTLCHFKVLKITRTRVYCPICPPARGLNRKVSTVLFPFLLFRCALIKVVPVKITNPWSGQWRFPGSLAGCRLWAPRLRHNLAPVAVGVVAVPGHEGGSCLRRRLSSVNVTIINRVCLWVDYGSGPGPWDITRFHFSYFVCKHKVVVWEISGRLRHEWRYPLFINVVPILYPTDIASLLLYMSKQREIIKIYVGYNFRQR